MFRSTSPTPAGSWELTIPDSPSREHLSYKPDDNFVSPLAVGKKSRLDFDDGCSTAPHSPTIATMQSPWDTPWQGMLSPELRPEYVGRVRSVRQSLLSTPRKQAWRSYAQPQTPRKETCKSSPLAPGAPRKPPPSMMLQALRGDSLVEVKEALEQDPDAAWKPLWEQNAELPLCFAVRSSCDPEILQLLRDHGAGVDSEDPTCQKALAFL